MRRRYAFSRWEQTDRRSRPSAAATLAQATATTGTSAITLSNVAVDIVEKTYGKNKGGFYLDVAFDIRVGQALAKTQRVQVEATCLIGGQTLSSKGSTVGEKLAQLAPGRTRRVDASPFALAPFDGPVSLCNLAFTLRKSFKESVPIGEYCYRDGAVAKGPCGKVL